LAFVLIPRLFIVMPIVAGGSETVPEMAAVFVPAPLVSLRMARLFQDVEQLIEGALQLAEVGAMSAGVGGLRDEIDDLVDRGDDPLIETALRVNLSGRCENNCRSQQKDAGERAP
jgi:hypothetical protein